MKKSLFAAVVACIAMFTSCGTLNIHHTGDLTGSIYGVWALDSKTIAPANSIGRDAGNQVDYSGVHFYLSLSEPRIALAKKGSFTQLDLKDVDVDGSQFSYNASKKQIGFTKTLWLTQGLQYEMRLSGTYKVLEMTRTKLVIQKDSMGVRTTYSFRRYR
ncbi:MAG: hypothetical protein IKR72_03210 [Bacteroidales bacterium]|nr:hypothetical protein [Bacteroidales bacterium]